MLICSFVNTFFIICYVLFPLYSLLLGNFNNRNNPFIKAAQNIPDMKKIKMEPTPITKTTTPQLESDQGQTNKSTSSSAFIRLQESIRELQNGGGEEKTGKFSKIKEAWAMNQDKRPSNITLKKSLKMVQLEQRKAKNRIRLYNQTTIKMLDGIVNQRLHQGHREHKTTKVSDLKQTTLKSSPNFVKSKINFSTISPSRSTSLLTQNTFRPKNHHRKTFTRIATAKTITSSRNQAKKNEMLSNLGEERRIQKIVNEMKIAKDEQKQRRKKVRSAQSIRIERENTRISKENFFHERIEAIHRENRERLQRQQKEYRKKLAGLEKLKKKQLQALVVWKRLRETESH